MILIKRDLNLQKKTKEELINLCLYSKEENGLMKYDHTKNWEYIMENYRVLDVDIENILENTCSENFLYVLIKKGLLEEDEILNYISLIEKKPDSFNQVPTELLSSSNAVSVRFNWDDKTENDLVDIITKYDSVYLAATIISQGRLSSKNMMEICEYFSSYIIWSEVVTIRPLSLDRLIFIFTRPENQNLKEDLFCFLVNDSQFFNNSLITFYSFEDIFKIASIININSYWIILLVITKEYIYDSDEVKKNRYSLISEKIINPRNSDIHQMKYNEVYDLFKESKLK